MSSLKQTIFEIYSEGLPANNIIPDRNRELIHFEQYDFRFQWNKAESIIVTYVPID